MIVPAPSEIVPLPSSKRKASVYRPATWYYGETEPQKCCRDGVCTLPCRCREWKGAEPLPVLERIR